MLSALNSRMITELWNGKNVKTVGVVNFKILCQHLLAVCLKKKKPVYIINDWTNNETRHLPNTSQTCYHFSQLAPCTTLVISCSLNCLKAMVLFHNRPNKRKCCKTSISYTKFSDKTVTVNTTTRLLNYGQLQGQTVIVRTHLTESWTQNVTLTAIQNIYLKANPTTLQFCNLFQNRTRRNIKKY